MRRAPTIFKGFVGHLKEKTLHGVHARGFFCGDGKEWSIKKGNVVLQKEAMLGVNLIA